MNGEHALRTRSLSRRRHGSPGRPPPLGPRRRAPVALAALLLAAAAGLLGPPPARGEFDGRLPATISSALDPGERLPEEAEEFVAAHGGDYLVFWDHALDTPRLLAARDPAAAPSLLELAGLPGGDSGTADGGSDLGERLEDAARGFIEGNRTFFGVGSSELEGPEIFPFGEHRLLVFGQRAGSIRVRGAAVRMLVTADGRLALVKSFVLRDATERLGPALPATPGPAEVAAVVDGLRARRDLTVLEAAPQVLFPEADPARGVGILRVVVQTEDDEPAEFLLDLAGGEPIEERRFIQRLGIVEGDIWAHYPTPDPRDPNFFFTEPTNMREYPVAGVLVTSSIDAVVTDEEGHFSIAVSDGGSEIVWSLLGGDCRAGNLIEADIPPEGARWRERGNLVCNVGIGLDRALDLRFTMLADRFTCGVPEVIAGRPIVAKVGEMVFLDLNPDTVRDQVASGRLMAFRHTRLYLDHAAGVIRRLGIAVRPLPPLAVQIIDDHSARRHYLASAVSPRICFAYAVEEQPMTPMLLNHEVAHHLLFSLTRYRAGEMWDCVADDRDPVCVHEIEDSLGEPPVVEAITDALAAYYADVPRFGYVDFGNFGGPLAYDISTGEGEVLWNPLRRAVGKLLWRIREKFVATAAGDPVEIETQKALAEDLLYKWIASSRCFDDTSRAFEFGPCLLAELRLLDALDGDPRHRRAIEEAFAEVPLLADMPFIRGDSNLDGRKDLSDPVFTLAYLFLGGAHRNCDDAMDANDDGRLDIADAVFTLRYLFLGGERPLRPFPDCGWDHLNGEDALTCEEAIFCSRAIAGRRPGGGGE